MGLLSKATSFARKTLSDREDFVIAYLPAGGSSFPTMARPGRSTSRLESEETFALKVDSDDFLIRCEKLVQLGRDPKKGDQIIRQLGNATLTYEVLPLGDEAEWRWSDPATQTEYRIHTKLISTKLT